MTNINGWSADTEMLRLGINYVKEKLNAGRIELGVFTNNTSAKHCYEAVGFKTFNRRKSELSTGCWECIDMELFLE